MIPGCNRSRHLTLYQVCSSYKSLYFGPVYCRKWLSSLGNISPYLKIFPLMDFELSVKPNLLNQQGNSHTETGSLEHCTVLKPMYCIFKIVVGNLENFTKL